MIDKLYSILSMSSAMLTLLGCFMYYTNHMTGWVEMITNSLGVVLIMALLGPWLIILAVCIVPLVLMWAMIYIFRNFKRIKHG